MSRLKLATQLNIIFSFVTTLGGLFFLFILNLSFTKAYENQNKAYLSSYFEEVLATYEDGPFSFSYANYTQYNDFFIIRAGDVVDFTTSNVPEQDMNMLINQVLSEHFTSTEIYKFQRIEYTIDGEIAYIGLVKKPLGGTKYAVFVVSNVKEYVRDMTGNIPFYATLAFLNILVLGNIIIWLWSTSTVGKIRKLQESVDQMISEDYQTEVVSDNSAEEIESLAQSINNMRLEIKSNEDTKKEMIQNLGHDLKTPIAVIKSYAEAIQDGIEGTDATDIIIKQSDILNKKVKQIIEYSKIGYTDSFNDFEETSFKQIINQVVNNYKYITDLNFIVDIETDWLHFMDPESCHVAISNIIDNAVRYGKTKIVIQVRKNKLTIFNDGEHIEPTILPKIFKAYEKGNKGQFGLGLAIVKETMDRFGLKVSVQNHANGVLFTIEQQ